MENKKIGLVLGGGGAKGAFQIGAIDALIEMGYEIVATTGTSIGSFNSAFLAAGQFELLKDIWLSGKASNIITNETMFGKFMNLLTTGGLYDSGHLHRQLKKLLNVKNIADKKIACKFSMTPLDTKRTIYYSNYDSDFNVEDLYDAIVASMTLPIGYPVAKFKGMNVVDGGFTEVVPVKAIMDIVKPDTRIIIIPCNDIEATATPYTKSTKGLIGSAEAFYYSLTDMLWAEAERDDVKIGLAKHWQDTDKFTLIMPKVMNITESGDFDKNKIRLQSAHGYQVTKGIMRK